MTEEKPKLEMESVIKLENEVFEFSASMEEVCNMLGVMGQELSRGYIDAKQTIVDPSSSHKPPKVTKASNDLVDQITSLDQFFSNQVRALEQAKKQPTGRGGPGMLALRIPARNLGAAQGYLTRPKELEAYLLLGKTNRRVKKLEMRVMAPRLLKIQKTWWLLNSSTNPNELPQLEL